MSWILNYGAIGSMSWESIYYKLINERVRDRMGPLHSAPRRSKRSKTL